MNRSQRTPVGSLYSRLPRVAQHVGVSLAGAAANRLRYGGDFDGVLAGYMARDYMPRERLEAHRQYLLGRTLERASKTPFYRAMFNDLGVTWRDLLAEDAFSELPVTTKSHLQSEPSAFIPEGGASSFATVRSSGTTGASVAIPKSKSAVTHQWAVWWRHRLWHGIRRGEWSAVFASSHLQSTTDNYRPAWRLNLPGRELRLSSFHLTERQLYLYVEAIRKRQIRWIHGYPSAVSILAEYARTSDARLHGLIRWVTTSSENLTDSHRRMIVEGLGVEPVESYGLAEGVANASQCPEGRLHIDDDFAFVEIAGISAPRLVGTPFWNEAYCLLRYDTGDIATPGGACVCGRPGRVIVGVDGRADDVLVRADGSVAPRISPAFSSTPGLAEAQVVQSLPGSAVVRYVPGAEFAESTLCRLEDALRLRLGSAFEIAFERVDRIPRTSSGKVRLVKSEVR